MTEYGDHQTATKGEDWEVVEDLVGRVIANELRLAATMHRELRDIPGLIADALMLCFDIRRKPGRPSGDADSATGFWPVVREIRVDEASDSATVEMDSYRRTAAQTIGMELPNGGRVDAHLDSDGRVTALGLTPASTLLTHDVLDALAAQ